MFGCLHNYTLTTEDMKKIEDADIFIINGLGMESFIEKAMTSNENMEIIDSSSDITDTIQDGEETNAHIWTNIDNYILQVTNIAEGLISLDEQNAEIYKNNLEIYISKLEALKENLTEELQGLNGEKAVSLNEAFEYLGESLGMEITTVETDHEESTLSAETLKNIIDKMNDENIDIIIIDKDDNEANANAIAEETGATIYKLNSGLTGNLDKDAYIEQMEENIQILANAL